MAFTAFTTSFTPTCTGSNVSVSGVTTAATAYDWFSPTGSGTLATFIASMPTSTLAGKTNKAFVQFISQEARTALLPLVKAELYNTKFNSTKTLVSNNITTILNTLTSIQDSDFISQISTLTPSYNSALTTINTSLNSLKSFENRIYATTDSINVNASVGTGNVTTSYNATTTLTNFTTAKIYLSKLLEPTTLSGNSTIPNITSVNNNIGNAATLATLFTNAQTALATITALPNNQALIEMSAKNIFDHYSMAVQGYASTGTTGKWASGSAPVGIVPGIDYEVHLTGAYQTGVAVAGTAGAPSAITNFW
ncbi:MAG: hypothetical protein ACK4OM_05125 [Alphaproteobacteria bacterium]